MADYQDMIYIAESSGAGGTGGAAGAPVN